jgi:hypothetical protein
LPVSNGVYLTRHVSELSFPLFSPSSPPHTTSPKVPFPLLVNVTVPEGLLPSAVVTVAVQVAWWPSTTVDGAHETDVVVGILPEADSVAVVVAVTVVVTVVEIVVVVGEAKVDVWVVVSVVVVGVVTVLVAVDVRVRVSVTVSVVVVRETDAVVRVMVVGDVVVVVSVVVTVTVVVAVPVADGEVPSEIAETVPEP